jgi:penicillin amidase
LGILHFMKAFHRYTLLAVATLCLLCVAAVGTVAWILYGTLPSYSGTAHIHGLGDKTTVYRDDHGVPHIFAKTMNDAARALGYVHASERLFQMEMQRRAGQGRLSEIVGAPMIDVDKFIRTLGLYQLAESSFASMSPDAQDYFKAYAEGVNSWLEQHPRSLPPEFALLGFNPEPWKPADSVVWGKLMALQLSKNYKLEVFRATLAKKLSTAQMHDLFPPYGNAPMTVGNPQAVDNASFNLDFRPIDKLGSVTGLDHAASNEWVISGKRTESGKPILANDPHLTLGAPILWYLARIVTPDLTVSGASVPGLPVILLGQNQSIAWGMTTTGSDVQDLFIESIDPVNPTHYLTPNGSEPFGQRHEVIHVKGMRDIALNVRTTRHGPVLSDIDQSLLDLTGGPGKVMALAFTGLGANDTSAEAMMRINRVTGWQDFLAAMKLYQAPPQNVVFADAKGGIGFINPGLLPVRKKGNGTVPVDGASGAYDWGSMVPFDQMPKMFNPPSGVIFNANNALVSANNKPYLGVDWEEPFRAERLQEIFEDDQLQTLDSSAAIQADHVSLAARQLLPFLTKQKTSDTRLNTVLDMLRTWDGAMDKNRPEPLIFDAWLHHMHERLFAKRLGDQMKSKGPFAAASIAFILNHDGAAWCDDKNCNAIIMAALDDALNMITDRHGSDMTRWAWGTEHRALLTNKVFTHVPKIKDVADLDLPSSGDFYTLDRGGSFEFDADHPFARVHGGGYRAIYDLNDTSRSRFMITTGESGHPLSPHYSDLAPLWVDVKAITLTGTAQELSEKGFPHLNLRP